MEAYFPKGHRFVGPEGQYYELIKDVYRGDVISLTQFKAGGGAPEPTPSSVMPWWFIPQLRKRKWQ